jgi:hypothetical protein
VADWVHILLISLLMLCLMRHCQNRKLNDGCFGWVDFKRYSEFVAGRDELGALHHADHGPLVIVLL